MTEHNCVTCRRDGTISYASRTGHWIHDVMTVPESELAYMAEDDVRKIKRHIARSTKAPPSCRLVEDAEEQRRRHFRAQCFQAERCARGRN